ncbi:MAG: hypothetical protein AAFU38_20795, partial [Bacteroidota bacterium]
MNITKVSWTPAKTPDQKNKMLLKWSKSIVNDEGILVEEKRQIESTDVPHSDFLAALRALKPVVNEACMLGIDRDDLDEQLTIKGLTLSETADDEGDDAQGVTITALRELDWSGAPLVLNTPFSVVGYIPHDEAEIRVEAVEAEAIRYIKGKRAQGGLFDAVRDAVEDLRPKPGSGVTSISITDRKGNGTRITADSVERISATD